jgi:hypothetical protein
MQVKCQAGLVISYFYKQNVQKSSHTRFCKRSTDEQRFQCSMGPLEDQRHIFLPKTIQPFCNVLEDFNYKYVLLQRNKIYLSSMNYRT